MITIQLSYASCSYYYISEYDLIPFKNQLTKSSWTEEVNSNYSPQNGPWNESLNNEWSYKCLSYAASSVADWFTIQEGGVLRSYINFVRGENETGANPRLLETIYHDRHETVSSQEYGYSYLIELVGGDPLTHEQVPNEWKGYAEILKEPPFPWIDQTDPNIPESIFTYSVYQDEFAGVGSYEHIVSRTTLNKQNKIINAMEQYGILYISEYGNKVPYSLFGTHAIVLVGYKNCGGDITFLYHDSDGTDYEKEIDPSDILDVFIFKSNPSWPTFHHDNRRTGFTTLKGDFDNSSEETSYFVAETTETGIYDKISIGDLEGDKFQDIIVATSRSNGGVIRLECKPSFWNDECKSIDQMKMWPDTNGRSDELGIQGTYNYPPSIGDLDGVDEKEIVVSVRYAWGSNDETFVYAINKNGDILWSYAIPNSDYSTQVSTATIHDIDLDGNNEVIFSTYKTTGNGSLYVLYGNTGNLKYGPVDVGLRGAAASVSIADVQGDDYPEIFVPSAYGVKVFEFENNDILPTPIWSGDQPDGISGSVVLSDVDRDNEYEAVYTTSSYTCPPNGTCDNHLYVVDADTGNNDAGTDTKHQPLATPAIANSQDLGTFDKFASYNSQRWAFNYITTGESYTSMINITPAFYVLEIEYMTIDDISVAVQGLINNTII